MHVLLWQLAASVVLSSLGGALALRLPLAPGSPHVERFTVDLDRPASERWREVALAYRDVLPALFVELERQLHEGRETDPLDWLQTHNVPAEYVSELVGFAGYVDHPQVTIDRLVLWQLFYELGLPLSCSGILVATENGTVVHGRNVDTSIKYIARGRRMDAEDLVIETLFVRAGRPLFTSVGFVGQIGVAAGMTLPGPNGVPGWSFQQNPRFGVSETINLKATHHGGLPYAFFARSLMESGLDYRQAVRKAMTTKLIAPMYLLFAGSGPWEGAVLTMDRVPSKTKKAALHRVQVLSPSIDRWFLVQTNTDFWTWDRAKGQPDGIRLMASLGQSSANAETVLLTLRTTPLFNDLTTLTWLGVPSTGRHTVYKSRESLRLMAKAKLGPEAALRRLAGRGRSAA